MGQLILLSELLQHINTQLLPLSDIILNKTNGVNVYKHTHTHTHTHKCVCVFTCVRVTRIQTLESQLEHITTRIYIEGNINFFK